MKALTEELKKDTVEVEQTITLFNDEQFNRIPFEGSWTAGQVAEHTLKSLRGSPVLLTRNVAPANRDPETHVKALRDMFLNFNIKFEAAEALRPSDGHHDLQELKANIISILDKLADISEKEELTLLCTGFEFPGMGQLTQVEILNFISAHTQRHIHQLKNIKAHL